LRLIPLICRENCSFTGIRADHEEVARDGAGCIAYYTPVGYVYRTAKGVSAARIKKSGGAFFEGLGWGIVGSLRSCLRQLNFVRASLKMRALASRAPRLYCSVFGHCRSGDCPDVLGSRPNGGCDL
jgi:hypothetical protein